MLCRIQQYLRERQAREDEEVARKAGKKEVADRIYERLKGQAEAEAAAREEEDRLINLLHAEEEAERARRSAVTCGAECAAMCCINGVHHDAECSVLAGRFEPVRAALCWLSNLFGFSPNSEGQKLISDCPSTPSLYALIILTSCFLKDECF